MKKFMIFLVFTLITPVFADLEFLRDVKATESNDNPFTEGTEKRVLTEVERTELLEYLSSSKLKLEEALEEAKGKGFDESKEIYVKAIIEVVLASYKINPRSELLMRMALNQALELTVGLPTSDGKKTQKPGILQSISNQDLLSLIIEDSIKLALAYVEEDKKALEGNKLLDLPFIDFAIARLLLARKWDVSIFELGSEHDFLVKVLEHFLATVSNAQQMHRAKIAEVLIKVDEVLKGVGNGATSGPVVPIGNQVRKLRNVIKKILSKIPVQSLERLQAEHAEWSNAVNATNFNGPNSNVLGPVVRVGDKGTENICSGSKGSVCNMTQSEAKKYCADQGGRLPTIEELAQFLYPDSVSKTERDGFTKISPKDETPFYYNYSTYYYNYSTYKNPESKEEVHWFWSASVHPSNDDYVYNLSGFGDIYYAAIFNNSNGIYSDARGVNYNSVRCVLR